jgi:hypothetical protein
MKPARTGSPAFLLGVPRSGTTLLSALLNQHPAVLCPAEPWLMLGLDQFGQVHPASACGPRLLQGALEDFWPSAQRAGMIRNWAGALYGDKLRRSGKSVFIDKTPRYHLILERLLGWFPEAPLIVLVRHPLDVAASMAATWNVDLADAVSRRLDHRLAIDYCVGHTRLAQLILSPRPRLAVVRYEELVRDPSAAMAPVWTALGIESVAIDPSRLDLAANPAVEGRMGDQKIRATTTVHAHACGRWREQFSADQARALAEALGRQTFADLGYAAEWAWSADGAGHGQEVVFASYLAARERVAADPADEVTAAQCEASAAIPADAGELAARARLIERLDADLKSANADRIVQAGRMAELDVRREAAERQSAERAEQVATATAKLTMLESATAQTATELEARSRLLTQLDAQLREANADRIAQATALAELEARRQAAERHAAEATEEAAAAMAQLSAQESAAAQTATELEARARLLTQLDAQLREANADRIAQATALAEIEARRQVAERHAAEAAEEAASAMAQLSGLESAAAQTATELEARARLIAQLDAQLREANADRVARGEVIGGLQARLGELERRVGDLAPLTARLPDAERLARESVEALRLAKERLEALRDERSALQEQAAELAASAQGAHLRGEAAERECAARQVVIDELARARDAFAAALAGRPRPWYERLVACIRRRS